MILYETVFVITPAITPENVMEVVTKFRKVLIDAGCKIERDENWGLKRDGYNRLFEFQAPGPSAVTELETSFRRDERVLRYKTVKLG